VLDKYLRILFSFGIMLSVSRGLHANKSILSPLAAPSLFATAFMSGQRQLETEKGETRDALVPHPLSWWTKNPLRLDTSGDLMLGFKAPDGELLTTRDYSEQQTVSILGTLSGHKIVQIFMTIRPGPRVIAAAFADENQPFGEWKALLVESGERGSYVEIYALHCDSGGLIKETSAAIYGKGPDAVLGTYDPVTGNGGGCLDGYWWFDKAGAHSVDFSPLIQEVSRAIPPNALFTSLCWALHPESSKLESWVQRKDADCHACGGLGEVHASYRIEHGSAKPVSVSFEPAHPQ
jgi:hypothetical protein